MQGGLKHTDLRNFILRHPSVIITGAGVPVDGTNGSPAASWEGLLESGITRCESFNNSLPPSWGKELRELTRSGEFKEMQIAAREVERIFWANKNSAFSQWLKETLGDLRLTRPELITCINSLSLPILNINHDNLFQQASGQPCYTWRNEAAAEELIWGKQEGILNLYGVWDQPASFRFGSRIYSDILNSSFEQRLGNALKSIKVFLYLGCSSEHLNPNLIGFLNWLQKVCSEQQIHQIFLVQENEVEPLKTLKPDDLEFTVLTYGDSRSDLIPFLCSLKTSENISFNSSYSGSTPSNHKHRLFCFGREESIDALVGSVCGQNSGPVPVLGSVGVGKSAICAALLHDFRVVKQFGVRRFWVQCDSNWDQQELIQTLATFWDLEDSPDTKEVIFDELSNKTSLLILDGLEGLWHRETKDTEHLLCQLEEIPGLSLVVSLRGSQRPLGPSWQRSLVIKPLDKISSREFFLFLSRGKFHDDPDLDGLLSVQGGVPLALSLLACITTKERELKKTLKSWHLLREQIIEQKELPDLDDVYLTLDLVIQTRLGDEARRLLGVLAFLPKGILHGELKLILPELGSGIVSQLIEYSLIYSDGRRLKILESVRFWIRNNYQLGSFDIVQIVTYYIDLINRIIEELSFDENTELLIRLNEERANVEVMISLGFTHDVEGTLEAAITLIELNKRQKFKGTTIIQQAITFAKTNRNLGAEAKCLQGLGELSSIRGNFGEALSYFDEALELHKRDGNLLGAAHCTADKGHLALLSFDYEQAVKHYQTAFRLFDQTGDKQGAANCLLKLAGIELDLGDMGYAATQLMEAQRYYCEVADKFGEATCLARLADLSERTSERATARNFYEQALILFEQLDARKESAECLWNLSDIALDFEEYKTVETLCEAALHYYSEPEDVLGKASCLKRLGDISRIFLETSLAKDRFQEALIFYRRASDTLGEADCCKAMGDLALETGDFVEAKCQYEVVLMIYRCEGQEALEHGIMEILLELQSADAIKTVSPAMDVSTRTEDVDESGLDDQTDLGNGMVWSTEELDLSNKEQRDYIREEQSESQVSVLRRVLLRWIGVVNRPAVIVACVCAVVVALIFFMYAIFGHSSRVEQDRVDGQNNMLIPDKKSVSKNLPLVIPDSVEDKPKLLESDSDGELNRKSKSLHSKGRSALVAEKWGEAQKFYEDLLKVNSNDGIAREGYELASRELTSMDIFEQLIELFRENDFRSVIEMSDRIPPNSIYYQKLQDLKLVDRCFLGIMVEADAYLQTGQWDRAFNAVDYVLSKAPQGDLEIQAEELKAVIQDSFSSEKNRINKISKQARKEKASSILENRCLPAVSAHDDDLVLQDCREVLTHYNLHPAAINVAKVYERRSDKKKALKYYRKARAVIPAHLLSDLDKKIGALGRE